MRRGGRPRLRPWPRLRSGLRPRLRGFAVICTPPYPRLHPSAADCPHHASDATWRPSFHMHSGRILLPGSPGQTKLFVGNNRGLHHAPHIACAAPELEVRLLHRRSLHHPARPRHWPRRRSPPRHPGCACRVLQGPLGWSPHCRRSHYLLRGWHPRRAGRPLNNPKITPFTLLQLPRGAASSRPVN